jgi:hypothetical protein
VGTLGAAAASRYVQKGILKGFMGWLRFQLNLFRVRCETRLPLDLFDEGFLNSVRRGKFED